VYRNYEQIISGALRRAAELEAPGVVIGFDTLPPMTEHPQWGLRIVEILLKGVKTESDRSGLKSVLRVTPNDNREFERPPLMRHGRYFDAMLELFDSSAGAGAELLCIESVGGKELHDDALLNGDIAASIFSLCILGARDMEFLWNRLDGIVKRHGVVCAGDTACGFWKHRDGPRGAKDDSSGLRCSSACGDGRQVAPRLRMRRGRPRQGLWL
jgi:methanol--5-hydroxybenzimidazolylcobamide Co-methyltransferase